MQMEFVVVCVQEELNTIRVWIVEVGVDFDVFGLLIVIIESVVKVEHICVDSFVKVVEMFEKVVSELKLLCVRIGEEFFFLIGKFWRVGCGY